MGENLLNDCRVFDAGDHFHRAAALPADKKINESLDHANENYYLYASLLAHPFESLIKAVTHEEDNHRPAITGDCPAGLR
jgi:hypothetical protein